MRGGGLQTMAAAAPVSPYLVLALGVVAVSFASPLIKMSDAPALMIAMYRLLFATLALSPVTLVRGRAELSRLQKRDFLLALTAGVFLALHFYSWITSLKYTSIASSVVLVTLQPLFVVVGAYLLFGERVSARAAAGGVVALAGSLLIGMADLGKGRQELFGDFLALVGAAMVAAYFLIGRDLRRRLTLLPYVTLVYGAAAVLLVVLAIAGGERFWPYSARNWAIFLALALVPNLVGHSSYNWSLRYLPASVVAVAGLGEPVGASVLAAVTLGEVPGLLQVVGGVITITGVYVFVQNQSAER